MRCPACGAAGALEDVGHLLRCARCTNEFDRKLRPYGPLRSNGRVAAPISEDSMPTMVADVTPTAHPDQTHFDLADELPTDPRQHAPKPAFMPPPPVIGASPFAPPPPKDALDRGAQHKPYSRALGDGGPPVGLDLLVLVLSGLNLASMGVWWRSNAPLANVMILPLMTSIVITYFFWKGRNWARFLVLLGSICEIVLIALGFAMLRPHLTGIELFVLGIRLLLDGWIVYFSIRPDTVAYFEKRRR